jgi:hypothetical protein
MGDTLRFARRMNLIAMEPRGDLSSTGYALADPGRELLVLVAGPTEEAFTVTLAAGRYSVEWFSIVRRRAQVAGTVTAERDGPMRFVTPFSEPGAVVLYLLAEEPAPGDA